MEARKKRKVITHTRVQRKALTVGKIIFKSFIREIEFIMMKS